MKTKTFLLLLLLRFLPFRQYYQIRCLFQNKSFGIPKVGSLSYALYSVLSNRNRLDKNLRIAVANRLKVRDYVRSTNGDIRLPELIWHGTPFEYLRTSITGEYYLKHVASSGRTLLVNSRLKRYYSKLWIFLSNFFDYGWLTREWYYVKDNRYIAEKPVSQTNRDLTDYKFYVTYGSAFLVQVDEDRNSHHRRMLFEISDGEIRYLEGIRLHHYEPGRSDIHFDAIPKMIDAAQALGHEFDIIRVDLYLYEGEIYFGELTNCPGGSFERLNQQYIDEQMGRRILL